MIIDKLYQLEKMMVIDDVCEYSRLGKNTIRRSVISGTLKCGKRKGKLIFRKQDVDNWLGL